MKVTVLGSGAWGTALALALLENGHDVTLWSFLEEECKVLRETGENPMLKGVPLPKELKLTTDMNAVKGCGAVVIAEGAQDISVRLWLTDAVATLLGLDASAVAVYPSKGGTP